MKVFSLIYLTFCIAVGVSLNEFPTAPTVEQFAIGGKNATLGQFPYQVFFMSTFNDRSIFCGTIISNRFIIASATYFQGALAKPQFFLVTVGSITRAKGDNKMTIDKIIVHEKYDHETKLNDIALVRTTNNIAFSDTVQPIALPTQRLPDVNIPAIVAGWGGFGGNYETLQFFQTHTISQAECSKIYYRHDYQKYIHGTSLCTVAQKGIGTCFEDNGGALVDTSNPHNKVAIGIVSMYTLPCASNLPDFYTRIDVFIDWIQEKMKE